MRLLRVITLLGDLAMLLAAFVAVARDVADRLAELVVRPPLVDRAVVVGPSYEFFRVFSQSPSWKYEMS